MVKWTYEACYKEAKKYTKWVDFQEQSPRACAAAYKYGWISDYTWLEHKHKDDGFWNYENCYNEAIKYSSKSGFKEGCNSAYRSSIRNGWIDEYTWFTKPNKKWTYETCMEESKKYSIRSEFSQGSSGAYHVALKNGWIEDFTWLLDGRSLRLEKYGKWTKEVCFEEAKKYKSRGEFAKKNESAYRNALKFGWIDNYTWLKDERFDIYTDKIDCVYVYEFIDQKSAYIGRTLIKRQKDRDWEHIFKNDSVSNFAKENNISIPEMKILETDLTLKEGAEKEAWWIEKYSSDGWTILNKAKAGSIGMIGKGKTKYTYDVCLELSKDCNTRAEFEKTNSRAYHVSLKNGWIEKFNFKDGKIVGADKRRKYDYQTCYEEAKKYKTITEFENGNSGACRAARANGWMKDYTWFTLLWQEKWDKETCYKEAKKYNKLSEFRKNSPGALNAAFKNDWLKDYIWLKSCKKPNGYWTYETCSDESKKYKTRGDFQKGAPGAYKVSRKHGWLDEFFPKTK